MNKVKKTLATLALGLSLASPAFAQQSPISNIRKVDVNYESMIPQAKSDSLYGKAFNAAAPEKGELKNSIEGRGLNLYYQSGKDNLTSGDLSDIVKYTNIVGKPNYIKIEASADKVGSSESNQALSYRRAEGVKEQLEVVYPESRIEILALGERPGENLAERRKVKVTVDNPISEKISKSNADYFLVDMSGSMQERLVGSAVTRAGAVKYSSFPQGSEVYVYSGKEGSNKLEEIQAYGNTPLYNSMVELIAKAKDSTEIEVFTDGLNSKKTCGGTAKAVVEAAKKKGIKLSMTSIGMPKDWRGPLAKISRSTKGTYRAIRK